MRQILSSSTAHLGGAPSLAVTLLWALLLPLLTISAFTGWYSIQLLEGHTKQRMQQDIELIARAIRLPLSHAMERGYQRTVQQALDSAFSIDRVYGAYVYDSDGNTIAASGFQQGKLASEKVARIASEGEQQSEFGRIAGEELFSYFVPLTDAGGQISGLLQVTRHGHDFDEYMLRIRQNVLLTVTISGIFLAGLLLAGHRWAVGRHLATIEHSLLRIGRGELSHRLHAGGARELHQLAFSINHMLDAIEHSRQQLQQMGHRLHQAEKMAALGQLSAGVAHELGSPLSTVDGQAQRLLRREDLPKGTQSALLVIRKEAARMERIIRQLLDFGRKNPLDLRSMPAESPLHDAVERLRLEAHVAIQYEPNKACEERLFIDPLRLDQALSNLLRNALQAAKSQVRVSTHCDVKYFYYRVEDDGEGIDPALHEHLFEPFFTTKPVGQGTGLGLAVAHAAARDHSGEIRITPSTLGGACFTVHIPRHQESA